MPGNLIRFNTNASMALINIEPDNTKINTIVVFKNALVIRPVCHAVIKFPKKSQCFGRTITLVVLYSSTVLNVVIITETKG
ncbi:hypothetical protein, partial [Treponema sp. R6D11]